MAAVDSAITAGGARRKAGTRQVGTRQAGARQSSTRQSGAPQSGALESFSGRVRVPRESAIEARVGVGPDLLVDVDIAGVSELDRLPGIGPALAARIVADRDAHGPFGSLQRLERVKGIGPSLAKKLEPHVTFSLPPRLSDTEVPLRERVARP